jgi:putative transcriptional regulator
MVEYITREFITGADLREMRALLGLTQKELASFLRCSKRTVENWETKAEKITGPLVPLLEILIRHPEQVKALELPQERLKLRLWYYYEHQVCTIIDVDELRQMVSIRNYTNNPLMRAFGINTEPTFEDYKEFLASRCFPETRDKMKLQLKELGIPFYDPLLIIEKTEGRMADDHFWIRIDRG